MIASARLPVVGVQPAAALTARYRLFRALEVAFDVRFVPWHPDGPVHDGLVTVGHGAGVADAGGVPALVFAALPATANPSEPVRLARSGRLDRRLRGIELPARPVGPPLPLGSDDEVLAAGPSGAAWTRRRGLVAIDRVRVALPVLADDEVLRDGFAPDRALGLVALVAFLRALVPGGWTEPPLRASFVFDDPNLRRLTYGHLDYRHLLAHADEHGYHAAIAMIPLDAGHTSSAAVDTFRTRRDRLSLVMHGNDHTRDELLQPAELPAALALAAQALRRIERFETATGVRVDRVMMPPHGLCSPAVVRSLGMLGYDALSAIHPCPWTERPRPDRPLAGWSPAELVDGCTIVPRFPLTCSATEIALRAFLGQPLVLYGHHGDVADGLEPLAAAAARVNRLGDVRWCSLGEIVRGGYALQTRDGVAAIRPWATRLRVVPPPEATAVTVLSPLGGTDAGVRGWTIGPEDEAAGSIPFGTPRPLAGHHTLDVRLRPRVETDPRSVPDPPGRTWPAVRRRATETRDRLAPHTPGRHRRPTTGRTP